MVLLDSSVIIAYFRENERDHKRAEKIFDENRELRIPDFVLSEVLTVLKIRESMGKMVQALEFLINSEGIEIFYTDEDMFDSALGHFAANKNALSFVDTVLLKISEAQKTPLMTFDKELAKIASRR
jgi:predicted nucleic acid-binding protein